MTDPTPEQAAAEMYVYYHVSHLNGRTVKEDCFLAGIAWRDSHPKPEVEELANALYLLMKNSRECADDDTGIWNELAVRVSSALANYRKAKG